MYTDLHDVMFPIARLFKIVSYHPEATLLPIITIIGAAAGAGVASIIAITTCACYVFKRMRDNKIQATSGTTMAKTKNDLNMTDIPIVDNICYEDVKQKVILCENVSYEIRDPKKNFYTQVHGKPQTV